MRAGKGRKYDYKDLPNDVGGLMKAVAKGAADVAGYAVKVATRPFRFPSDKAIRRMVDDVKKQQDEAIRRAEDPYGRP